MKRQNIIETSARIVSIKRSSDRSNIMVCIKDYKEAFPTFVYYGTTNFKEHARVHIKGHVECIPAGSGFRQRFIADEIAPEKTMTEETFGIKGIFYPNMYSHVYLAGKIIKFETDKNNWHHILLDLGDGNTASLSMKALERSSDFSIGDNLFAVCYISTNKKTLSNGNYMVYENLIVNDAAVA